MKVVDITLTTKKPPPPQADFAFFIDFKKDAAPASRIFSATHDFIKICESLDRELIASIDSNIEPVLMLEDIEASSLKTWVRTALTATNDQALKELDWKVVVGKYLVDAKYLILQWAEKNDGKQDPLPVINEIRELASQTDVRHIPDYKPVSPIALINATKGIEKVKDNLVEGDLASFHVPTKEKPVDFNLARRISLEDLEVQLTSDTQSHEVPSMVLVVKKPDYLSSESMWEVRHGQRSLRVRIKDVEWLKKFQGRNVIVQPSDAIRCRVRTEVSYGYDNEVISEKHYVEEVYEVLENTLQYPLFE